jgi:hypothetical protein
MIGLWKICLSLCQVQGGSRNGQSGERHRLCITETTKIMSTEGRSRPFQRLYDLLRRALDIFRTLHSEAYQ